MRQNHISLYQNDTDLIRKGTNKSGKIKWQVCSNDLQYSFAVTAAQKIAPIQINMQIPLQMIRFGVPHLCGISLKQNLPPQGGTPNKKCADADHFADEVAD